MAQRLHTPYIILSAPGSHVIWNSSLSRMLHTRELSPFNSVASVGFERNALLTACAGWFPRNLTDTICQHVNRMLVLDEEQKRAGVALHLVILHRLEQHCRRTSQVNRIARGTKTQIKHLKLHYPFTCGSNSCSMRPRLAGYEKADQKNPHT